jgi:hypothetical protein
LSSSQITTWSMGPVSEPLLPSRGLPTLVMFSDSSDWVVALKEVGLVGVGAGGVAEPAAAPLGREDPLLLGREVDELGRDTRQPVGHHGLRGGVGLGEIR